jgi:SAM-dependent methyltransferase
MSESDAGERGGSFYDRPNVRDAYLAHRHAPVRSPNVVMEEPALLDALGEIGNRRVLDLGCGDGSFGHQVLERGGRSYLGVDGSAAMIERANDRRRDDRIAYGLLDIEDLSRERLHSISPVSVPFEFDLITARMSLHYVADLERMLTAATGLLAPGGRLLFSVVHPVVSAAGAAPSASADRTTQVVDRYFEPGPRRQPWFGETVTWHHRTIEDYVGAVHRCGLRLTVLSECPPVESLFAGNHAEYERRCRVPLMLLIGATIDPRLDGQRRPRST